MAQDNNPLDDLLKGNKDKLMEAGKGILGAGGAASLLSSAENMFKGPLSDEDIAQIESMYKNVLVPTQGLKDAQMGQDARSVLGDMAFEKGWDGDLVTSTLKEQGHITRKEAKGIARFIDDHIDQKHTLHKPSAYKGGHGFKGMKRWLVGAGIIGAIAGTKITATSDTQHINDTFDAVAQTGHTIELIEKKVSTNTKYKQCIVETASTTLTNSYVNAKATGMSKQQFEKDFMTAQQQVPTECRNDLGLTKAQTDGSFSKSENQHIGTVITGIGSGLAQKL